MLLVLQAIEVLIERMVAGVGLDGEAEDTADAATLPTANGQDAAPLPRQSDAEPAADDGRDGDATVAQADSKQDRRKPDRKHPPRNRLCPCGSKQKYKNCCGSAAALRRRAAPASSADAADAPAAPPKQLLI